MKKILSYIILKIYISIKKVVFNWMSDISIGNKSTKIYQPQLRIGKGKIICGENVQFGIPKRKGYYDAISYINLRHSKSKLIIEDDVIINNSFSVTSAGGNILIGKKTLIGYNVSIFDADFHPISPKNRLSSNFPVKDVRIGKNVWIGNDCKILKDVTIGDNTIIAINSVVKCNIPENCIAGGNPAIVIKQII